MSGIGVAALVLAAAWLGILSLVLVLVVRQIALITARLDHVGTTSVGELREDGPALGSSVPEPVARELPELNMPLAHLLLFAATCTPCRTMAAELRHHALPNGRAIVALVPGRKELADGLISTLPLTIRAIPDPSATEIAELLQLQTVPFALSTEGGKVVAKSEFLGSVADLLRFMRGSRLPSHHEIALTPKEGAGHVA